MTPTSEDTAEATSEHQAHTRWLDADEQRIWRLYLEATQLLSRRLGQELDESEHDLSLADYELLVRLSESPDRSLRMSDLADDLVHSRSRLTHAISRLEARGLVERRACPEDRRGVLAVMTPAGFAALEAAAPLHVAGVREHLFDRLSPKDVAALGRICATLAEHLR
ncbi:transcriptional regulator, MarR family [Quadrisphaera granulorum]|uniref:MarR family transcriptional regulator n=1 Tax=Quadrisphaera granulorum TaxID=317664 RepID=A0A316A8T0_9ACTN|nr:MarR family transcriptional regulator [Quadrisphaera granulorum]PWJ53254.1 MarR family transcriptional regulator [Quadrisphaera granulorum]SZE96928.1 transcriptional regulator, MarR family [Quadrisphaera granulorum]